jgi:hypothetical protein
MKRTVSSERQKHIEFSERSIEYSRNKIKILRTFKEDGIYEFKAYEMFPDKGQEYLVRLRGFSKGSVKFLLLACRYMLDRSSLWSWSPTTEEPVIKSFQYSSLHDIKRVKSVYLPMYVGWHWVSLELSQLIKRG